MTDNIKFFLALNYSDEKLAALLAHAESGRLGYNSCCCLIGIPTAGHSLKAAFPRGTLRTWVNGQEHYHVASRLPYAKEAEAEFLHLGGNDEASRKRLIPLIREEMARREQAREKSVEEAGVTV